MLRDRYLARERQARARATSAHAGESHEYVPARLPSSPKVGVLLNPADIEELAIVADDLSRANAYAANAVRLGDANSMRAALNNLSHKVYEAIGVIESLPGILARRTPPNSNR